jgi:hypothetical protein
VEHDVSIEVQRTVTREQFAKQLHTAFTLTAGDLTLTAELVEYSERPPTRRYEQFSLLFRVPRDAPVTQGTWEVQHDVLDSEPMFLVPVARDDEGLYLEAVFNRLIREAGQEE